MGQEKDLNRTAFDAFQALLAAWGPDDYCTAKSAVWAALEQGAEPDTLPEPATRTGRIGLRNGLRQWRRLHGDSPLLARYAAIFDASASPNDTDDDNPEQ
jgi:hypothetical protein